MAGPGVTGLEPVDLPGNDSRYRLAASIAALVGSDREARWIVEHVEATAAGGSTQAERAGTARALAGRRAAGEPLQYVLGRWAFRSLELQVDQRVLIPRPETEHVVEVALAELARRPRGGRLGGSSTGEGGPTCVDLGTGSGAIALSLASEAGSRYPGTTVWATDVSTDALDVARSNLAWLAESDPDAAGRVRLAHGWWFDALPARLLGGVDLVVANPPYVSEAEHAGLDPEVRRWEPAGALVAGDGATGIGGMSAIETVIAAAPRWLSPTGTLVVEMAPHQAPAAVDAAGRAGFARPRAERDLAGRLRMLVAAR